jgi:hypothetical protein
LDFTENELMRIEWEAWQQVVEELAKFGIDIEELQPHGAIVTWAETLVNLRAYQARMPSPDELSHTTWPSKAEQ